MPTINIHTAPPASAQILSPNGRNGIAAVLSFVIPGAGQIYKGDVGTGLVWFIAAMIGYFVLLFVPGLIIHILCIVSASAPDKS